MKAESGKTIRVPGICPCEEQYARPTHLRDYFHFFLETTLGHRIVLGRSGRPKGVVFGLPAGSKGRRKILKSRIIPEIGLIDEGEDTIHDEGWTLPRPVFGEAREQRVRLSPRHKSSAPSRRETRNACRLIASVPLILFTPAVYFK